MELLTIADFAAKVGVTAQAIYKRLKTDLAPYLVEENGVKFLQAEALELFKATQLQKENKELKAAKERIAELESQLQQAKEENAQLNATIAANNTRLFEILEKQMQLTENHQILSAQVQNCLTQLLPPVANEVETQKDELQTDENSLNKQFETVKQPFFKRFFKRP